MRLGVTAAGLMVLQASGPVWADEPAAESSAGSKTSVRAAATTETSKDEGPHVQLTAAALGDVQGTYAGGELRGSVGVSRFLDLGVGVNIGISPAFLATVRLHTPFSPTRRIRPFIQPRLTGHPVSKGYGGGAFAGILIEAGPGRFELGAAGQLYFEEMGYFSYAVFAMGGYEIDLIGKRPKRPIDPDRDRDGIVNVDDKCPDDPEDKDAFQDKDGCPELDNDADRIADTVDKCPLEPEDKDAFEDDDGCPDLDNDGDRIADAVDKCPMKAEDLDGFEDADGCPDFDNDADRIVDKADKCPDEAEDFDKVDDTDGCPDLDNDKDGIHDAADKCPDKPEVFNAYQDDDGCPDRGRALAIVTSSLVEITETIYFDTNKATIKRQSFKLLDAVAGAIAGNPTMRIRIEGHTDDVGSDPWNQDLSQRRAESIRDYLIQRGIDAPRLEAAGYGRTRPTIQGKSAKARAANRRVEFVILGARPGGVPQI